MGNTNVKEQKNKIDSRRSQLFAVLMKRKSEKPSESDKSTTPGYSFIKSRPVTRRMAIFGQDYEKSKVEKAKTVNLDFVYQLPKSRLTVNPHDCQPGKDYVTIERSIHGKDNERVFKSVLQEIFTPMPPTRKCRNCNDLEDLEEK